MCHHEDYKVDWDRKADKPTIEQIECAVGRQQIEARIAEINERIAATTQWGALLTALSEERRGLTRALLDFDNRPRTLPGKGD